MKRKHRGISPVRPCGTRRRGEFQRLEVPEPLERCPTASTLRLLLKGHICVSSILVEGHMETWLCVAIEHGMALEGCPLAYTLRLRQN